MWSYEKVAVASVSRPIVWEWWTNVEKWPQWDVDLSESALLGEVAVGTQGKMKVADDALISFVVTEVIPEERFVIKVSLFGASLFYIHSMTEEDGQLRITHGAQIRGIFGFFWRLLLHKKIEKTLLPALEALAAQVVAESARRAEIAAATAAATPAEQPAGESAVSTAVPTEEPKKEEALKPEEALAAAAEAVVAAGGGDPVENEMRAQDIHTQIEAAAQAPDVIITPPPVVPEEVGAAPEAAADEHTAVVAVSPVITKKETKRTK